MKKYAYLLVAGLFFLLPGNGFGVSPKGPYLGEEPPGFIPKVCAPRVISDRPVVGGTFSPDGREFYFCRFTGNSLRIFFTRSTPSGWSEPEEAEFNHNFFGGPPFYSPDGSQLIWRAARPFPDDWPGPKPGPGTLEEIVYWNMPRTEAGWGAPRLMQLPIPKNARQHGISTTLEGTVFTSYGNIVVRIPMKNNSFSRPQTILTGYSGAYPAVAPDESYVVLTKQGRPRRLMVSFKNPDGSWTEPKDLGSQINVNGMNGYPSISSDGKYLFYTVNHKIYWVSTEGMGK
jgi:Tol biopolymer transport system component